MVGGRYVRFDSYLNNVSKCYECILIRRNVFTSFAIKHASKYYAFIHKYSFMQLTIKIYKCVLDALY